MIDRYLRGGELHQPAETHLPKVLVEPVEGGADQDAVVARVVQPSKAVTARKHNFDEVEGSLSVEDASREAGRCLRCDLEFTRSNKDLSFFGCASGDAS